MRTLSTQAEDVLTSAKYDVHAICEVEDSTGAFISLATLGGSEWFEGANWDWSQDQPVAELTVLVRRDQGPSTGESVAPLDEDSTFNRDASAAFAALIDAGREIRLFTAATTVGGAPPATSEFDFVFRGEIDDVNWETSPLEIVSRSFIGAQLQDRWVESTGTIYSTGSTESITNVIREIIGDHTDLSTTIVSSTDPSFLINAYQQEKMRVFDAVTTLAQLIGFDLREKFDEASSSWVLDFTEPNRSASSSEKDFTFDGSLYYGVTQMNISRDDIRNVIDVEFGPSSSRQTVTAESTSSQDRFGRRWLEFVESTNSSIDTSSEADKLANAALSDLKDPIATHSIELPYWWPGELRDYYEFLGNDIHYDTDQFFASYSIRHELKPDRHRTIISARGQPAGQYLNWRGYPGAGSVRTIYVPVKIEAQLDRDAESATATLTVIVSDPRTKVVNMEHSDRVGSQAGDTFAAFSTSWTTGDSTGGDHDGTWTQSLSVPGGEESAIMYRVTLIDEDGNEKTEGRTFYTAHIDENTAVLIIPASNGLPYNETLTWTLNTNGTVAPGDVDTNLNWLQVITLPEGVTITKFAMHGFRESSTDTLTAELFRGNSTGVATSIASLAHATTDWATTNSGALSETVANPNLYTVTWNMVAGSLVIDALALWAEVTYIRHTGQEVY